MIRDDDARCGWAAGPASPPAPIGEVHLWHTDLDLPARRPDLLVLLCAPHDRLRAADMRVGRAKDRFVVRCGLHRVLLGGYAVGNRRIDLHTATAHLGADALFAFGRTLGLGTSIVPIPDADPMLARLPGLTNRERLALRRMEPGVRGAAASAVIAAKEAIGSARGRGLDVAMQGVELQGAVAAATPFGPFCVEVDGVTWSGATLRLGDDRIAAVAHDGPPRALRTWSLGAEPSAA